MFIPDPDLDFLPLSDPGVKKAPDRQHWLPTTVVTGTVGLSLRINFNVVSPKFFKIYVVLYSLEHSRGWYILKHRLPVQGYRTVEDLLSISIEDLEDVGFFKLGHQKRLLLGMRRVRELKRGMPTHVAQVQVNYPLFDTVFRIHDILVWIRIRIRGSMPLTNGSGFGSGACYFCHRPSRCQQKNNKIFFFLILTQVFLLITFWRYIYIIFQREKVKKSQKNSRNQGFSYYFYMMLEGSGSGSIPLTSGSGPGSWRPKNMWIRIRNTACIPSHLSRSLVISFTFFWRLPCPI